MHGERLTKSGVRYERISEATGRPILLEDIVKGYEYDSGDFVVLTDEDFKKAAVGITNPDREFYPDIGVTKRDLIDYYTEVAERIIPHLEDVEWAKMIDAALFLRDKLKGLGLTSFVKTTGGKGLHIAVPLIPGADWDGVKEFSRAVAESIVREFPGDIIATMSKAKRRGKIFIDYLRNRRGATSVVAYSTRARAGCPVSTPLAWDELSEKLRSDSLNIGNIRARLAHLKHDPWEGYFSVRQTITAGMRKKGGAGVTGDVIPSSVQNYTNARA